MLLLTLSHYSNVERIGYDDFTCTKMPLMFVNNIFMVGLLINFAMVGKKRHDMLLNF